MQTLDYSQADLYLQDFNIEPAFVDALAWSLIIGGSGDCQDNREYINHFIQTEVSKAEYLYELFDNLVEHNNSLLLDDEVAFLLPSDDMPMEKRLRALSIWCETFVAALGISKHLKNEELQAKVKEHLKDLVEISRMDASSSGEDYDNEEAMELDFMEVYEFLRITILNLDIEFKGFVSLSSEVDNTETQTKH